MLQLALLRSVACTAWKDAAPRNLCPADYTRGPHHVLLTCTCSQVGVEVQA